MQAANIPFLIFSDYDTTETKTSVNKQLRNCGLDPENCDELIDLGEDIESYLITTGYENELRQAANEFIQIWFSREEVRARELTKIEDNIGLKELLKKYKTKLAPIYGRILSDLEDGRALPLKVKELFAKIDTILNITDETGTI